MPEDLGGAGPLALLALAGLVAGWINTVAGAGSLLTLPALVFTGLDPSAANATNRVAVLATTIAAVIGYRRAGRRVDRREGFLAVAAMCGAGLGSFIATLLRPDAIRIAIVVAMLVMLPLSLVSKKKSAPADATEGDPASGEVPAPGVGVLAAFFAIGVYGGFLQAGVGVVVVLYLAHVHGTNLVSANVLKSVVILAITLIALSVFVVRAQTIDPLRGGVLAASSAVGGLMGARATLAGGEKLVRAGVVFAVLASIGKLLYDALV